MECLKNSRVSQQSTTTILEKYKSLWIIKKKKSSIEKSLQGSYLYLLKRIYALQMIVYVQLQKAGLRKWDLFLENSIGSILHIN